MAAILDIDSHIERIWTFEQCLQHYLNICYCWNIKFIIIIIFLNHLLPFKAKNRISGSPWRSYWKMAAILKFCVVRVFFSWRVTPIEYLYQMCCLYHDLNDSPDICNYLLHNMNIRAYTHANYHGVYIRWLSVTLANAFDWMRYQLQPWCRQQVWIHLNSLVQLAVWYTYVVSLYHNFCAEAMWHPTIADTMLTCYKYEKLNPVPYADIVLTEKSICFRLNHNQGSLLVSRACATCN